MKLGMIGLGRMGGNMARRLLRNGHEVVVTNRSQPPIDEIVASDGAIGANEISDLVAALESPRVVWVMVPSGGPTEEVISELVEKLSSGDLVIDGGNSNFRDSIRRSAKLAEKDIDFMDAGVSGGIWGLEEGYCIMAGGKSESYERIRPAIETLVAPGGALHAGPVGAGHYTKMVHNGIEYGMLQAFGEGFELLSAAKEFDLDLAAVAELWRHGSVVRSWLLDLLVTALESDPNLDKLDGYVEDSGEGRWTVLEAVERGVPATALAHALFARFTSRTHNAFSMKVIAALRKEFGGHAVKHGDL